MSRRDRRRAAYLKAEKYGFDELTRREQVYCLQWVSELMRLRGAR